MEIIFNFGRLNFVKNTIALSNLRVFFINRTCPRSHDHTLLNHYQYVGILEGMSEFVIELID